MNSTEPIPRLAGGLHRPAFWPIFAACLALATFRAAAADAYYDNAGIVTYPGTQTAPPMIDATNFVNSGLFQINFQTIPIIAPYYETSDTVNYTNTDSGTLVADTGFQFDTQSSATGARTMAGSFYNSGFVGCDPASDTSAPYGDIYGLLGVAQCLINATNIDIPGEVDVADGGLIQMTGLNVNLVRSLLTVENLTANANGAGAFGTNVWFPAGDLTPTEAESAGFPIPPGFLLLTNSTPYYQVAPSSSISNNLVRAVFIEDYSGSNVSFNVYFGQLPFPKDDQLGFGDVTIQWAASYVDYATGRTFTNYLYLNNDYAAGTQTNILPIAANGIPYNFIFTGSTTPVLTNVAFAPSQFYPLFQPAVVSNLYDVVNANFTSPFGTNLIANQAITNLPGRVQLTGLSNMDLTLAQISGPSYLSVQCTNQFNGSAGAVIETPYADLYLGVTNGYPHPMYVTNTIQAALPVWSGNVIAWNTRWTYVDATGVSNDFRVLIVSSQIAPTMPAQVQDLALYNTNSTVISDTFNIMRSFTATARSLTLTTNLIGYGATSPDGELNLNSAGIFWQSSVPNLRYLTNYGAIRTQNAVDFGYPLLTNVNPPVAAAATLAETATGTNVVRKDQVTIGTNHYMFVGTLTNKVANQVLIVPSSVDTTLDNLIAAINGAGGAGTAYSTNTRANPRVTAGVLSNHAFTVTALIAGLSGNTNPIAFTPATTSTNLTWSGHTTLYGGLAATTNTVQFLGNSAFINHGIVSDQGTVMYAGNFLSDDIVSNGINSFTLQSLTTTLTNGLLCAGGDVSITADSIVTSNLLLLAGKSLTLQATNLLTDGVPNGTTGLTNPNVWSVQGPTGSGGNGLMLPIKPAFSGLLGTTITNTAPAPNRLVANVWAGQDFGVSAAGFTNNAAIGRLILDAQGTSSQFQFSSAGGSNALYVDELVLLDQATNGVNNSYDFTEWLSVNPNMMVYFAQAIADGVSVAEKIDDASKAGRNNGGRLRWVPQYAGYFSATNLVSPDGTTNVVNAALAASSLIDSDGDGIPNAYDTTPFFLAGQLQFNVTVTNVPPRKLAVAWHSIPSATNYVFYKTNLLSPNWQLLTNFVSPAAVPPVGGWPVTNLMFDLVTNQARFYQLRVDPNNSLYY
jgi:hypothetical protein